MDNEKQSRTTAQSIILIENYNNVVRNTMEPTKTRKEWLSLETSMEDELTEYWGGDWGCNSEMGTLKHDSLAELYRSKGIKVHYVEWYSFKAK